MSYRSRGWLAPRLLLAATAVVAVAIGAAPVAASAGRARPTPRPGWNVDRVRFESLDPSLALVAGPFGAVRGAVEVRRTGAGFSVINELSLEDYLLGISEVPTSWPAEAQRAQAIAARTYAVHEILRRAPALAAAGADLCATDSCQVYAGLAKERRPGADAWSGAVMATVGQVLLHRDAPILAKYSSTNGGRSVAGGLPYLRAIDDPDDAISPYHRWRSRVALSDLAGVLAVPGPVTEVHRVADLVDTRWVAADGSEGVVSLSVADFRNRLNELPKPIDLPLVVPSTRFALATDGDALVIDGIGWGHGVGMSQFGALGKALRGMRAADILASYYGGLRPVATAPGRLPATVRVLVAQDLAAVPISGEGRFRVLDGAGRPVAVVADGRWQISAGPRGQVRIVPPEGQASVPAVTPIGLYPARPAPGQAVQVRFHLSGPAAVRVSLQPADGAPVVLTDGLVAAGETTQQLPPILRAGDYMVTISADAGGGRESTAPLAVRVAAPVTVSAAFRGPLIIDDARVPTGWPGLVALLLLGAVAGRLWPRLEWLRPGDPRSG